MHPVINRGTSAGHHRTAGPMLVALDRASLLPLVLHSMIQPFILCLYSLGRTGLSGQCEKKTSGSHAVCTVCMENSMNGTPRAAYEVCAVVEIKSIR